MNEVRNPNKANVGVPPSSKIYKILQCLIHYQIKIMFKRRNKVKNNKFCYASILFMLGFMLTPYPAQATIFKCVNQQDSVYYNDKPCPKKDKETQLKAIKDPKNGYIRKPNMEQKKEVLAAKGIVVGKDLTQGTDAKDKENKRKKENLVEDNANKKTLNSTNKNSVRASPTPPASFTMGSQTKIPTIEEELRGSLGSISPNSSKNQQHLTNIVE